MVKNSKHNWIYIIVSMFYPQNPFIQKQFTVECGTDIRNTPEPMNIGNLWLTSAKIFLLHSRLKSYKLIEKNRRNRNPDR